MRKIDRSSVETPASLLGPEAIAGYDAIAHLISADRVTFLRRVEVQEEIYSAPDVRDGLLKLFSKKCAYCEQPMLEGLVDHYRPKGSAADLHEKRTSLHHYSWLAYDWKNLYLTCLECSISKRNRFPVRGPRLGLLAPLEGADDTEMPLLLDPCKIEPSRHLDFDLDGYCRDRTRAGSATIEVLNLNRDQLLRSRAAAFEMYLKRIRNGDLHFAYNIFDPALPHIGAFEIMARRAIPALARLVDFGVPRRSDELDFFVKHIPFVSEQNLASILSASLPSPVLRSISVNIERDFDLRSGDQLTTRFDRSIRKILIEDFKGIDYLELDLPEIGPEGKTAGGMMLLADNGAGKTSVLQAIALAMMGPDRANQLGLKQDRLLRNAGEREWGIVSKTPSRVRVDFHSGDHCEITLDPMTKEFSGFSRYPEAVIGYGAHRLLDTRTARGRRATARVATLFDSRAFVTHPGAWLAKANTPFEPVARALAEVLVLQAGDGLTRDEEGNIFVRTYGQPTPVDVLSDGYRSVIAMAVDTMKWLLADWPELETARGVVLIDEIDVHLHPRWKLQIMGALREAMPQVQFIATTHDPLCLRGMGPGEVAVLKRSSHQTFDLVTDLPDFRGMSAEQLLMSDYFGLSTTADPELEIQLARKADALGRPDSSLAEKNRQIFDGLMIGDTPERQIADIAMLEYLHNRPARSGKEITQSRRRAIDAVLAAIEAGRKDQ